MTSCVSSMQGQQYVQRQAGGDTACHFGRTILLWLESMNPGEKVGANMEGLQCQTVNSLGNIREDKESF